MFFAAASAAASSVLFFLRSAQSGTCGSRACARGRLVADRGPRSHAGLALVRGCGGLAEHGPARVRKAGVEAEGADGRRPPARPPAAGAATAARLATTNPRRRVRKTRTPASNTASRARRGIPPRKNPRIRGCQNPTLPIYARQLQRRFVSVVTRFMGPPSRLTGFGRAFYFWERVLSRSAFLGSFASVVGNGSTEYSHPP